MRSFLRALALVASSAGSALAQQPIPVFTDALAPGFEDWSWATHSLTQTQHVRSGAGMSMEVQNYEGLYLHNSGALDASTVVALEFHAYRAAAPLTQLSISFRLGDQDAGTVDLAAVLPGGIPTGTWTPVRVELATAGVMGAFDGFWLAGGQDPQGTLFLDDMQLTTRAPQTGGMRVAVDVDPAADRHPVSPEIYGVNFGTAAQMAAMRWPVRRWGGNSVTRYNWQLDASNAGSDWFFISYGNEHPNPAQLPDNSAADRFVDETLAAGGAPLITVPTMGWVNRDRQKRWGFSVQKYGAQQQSECTVGDPSWCEDDAGNGVRASGGNITGNDPTDTSVAVQPSFVADWVSHLVARAGNAAQGGVRYYALDNEPALWNSTHRDIHPDPLTYDELWQRTVDHALAIKAVDPQAQLFGPAEWGWCAYFGSAADAEDPQGGCVDGADRAAHGGVPLLQWYLQQNCAHQQATGVRPVDVLDVHYYPQAPNVALTDGESTAALRLRTLRSLYDPTYSDESWIAEPVNLIPRLKSWIATACPGVKLALTEYNFGGDTGISSALAQVEALGIFGREGVDVATRWVAPEEGSRVEDAFRLFLDYDGQGGRVLGDSVRATSADVNDLGAYAVAAADGVLRVVLVNKATAARTAVLNVAGLQGNRTARRFELASTGLSTGPDQPFSGPAAEVVLQARTAVLLVIPAAGGMGGGSSSSSAAASSSASPSSTSGPASSSAAASASSAGASGSGGGGTSTSSGTATSHGASAGGAQPGGDTGGGPDGCGCTHSAAPEAPAVAVVAALFAAPMARRRRRAEAGPG